MSTEAKMAGTAGFIALVLGMVLFFGVFGTPAMAFAPGTRRAAGEARAIILPAQTAGISSSHCEIPFLGTLFAYTSACR